VLLAVEEHDMSRAAWRRPFCRVSSLLLLLSGPAAGCGGNSSDPPQANGLSLAKENCGACHDPGDGSYSGQTSTIKRGAMIFPANLTPDATTGIGTWSDDQIKNAIRTGVDDQGNQLCVDMPRFTGLSDDQLSRIVAFLRALPPIAKEIPGSTCQ
jgi:mono/diheme cytochrome c family protein